MGLLSRDMGLRERPGWCDTRVPPALQRFPVRNNQKFPEWFLWLTENGVRILILVTIAFVAVVYARTRTATEERLEAIQDTVQYEPPRAFRPPNLDAYAAPDVSIASLPIHQAVYVPVYSHIYYDGGRPYLLETTLSIRNVDPNRPVYLAAVDYYDTDGRLSKKNVDRLIKLDPLQTIDFLVERHDLTGGSGANFIVEWRAATEDTHAPLIEAVMVGRSGTNAISFVRESVPLPQRIVD